MKNVLIMLLMVFLSFGMLFQNIHAQDLSETELPDPGILPDSAFYGLKKAFEAMGDVFTVRAQSRAERHVDLAEKRMAEIKTMAEEGKPEYIEGLSQRYQERIEKANDEASQVKEQTREQVMERVSTATSKHLEILDEVYDKVPEQAKERIAEAREKSLQGNQEALRALARENSEKAAEIAMNTAESRAERIRDAAENEDDEEVERAAEEYGQYARFGQEISAIAQQIGQDPSKVDELVARATSIHLEILNQTRERVREQARESIESAIQASTQSRDNSVKALEENNMPVPEEVQRSIEETRRRAQTNTTE